MARGVLVTLVVNLAVLGWAIHAGWTLMTLMLFYWMENVALIVGVLLQELLNGPRDVGPDRSFGSVAGWLANLVVFTFAMAGFSAVHGAFVVFAFGGMILGSEKAALAEAWVLAPLLGLMVLVYGIALPVANHLLRGDEEVPSAAGALLLRIVTLHVGIIFAGFVIAGARETGTAVVVTVMLAKIAAEVAFGRRGTPAAPG